ncbi:FKBP-type peptidyl-prolyl cis-trans isomerase [Candidatus Venteria ishoeyi]|uniref:FKBP-type peptidyl-prolyl cis-trans isomerase n=1 Tax=Candidatus Venteria ishoeyi TaxID=1899563 RepID=UPI0025A62CDF|nr:FKBP-type peptidyl-prolyl cis-trans isomerase [Candidatus Venteria ishoeyi]MDM8546110.1 FKBP-type peptidyl-prolyl cis-trans isomerase [Candidatus Venteria ishoeyi]
MKSSTRVLSNLSLAIAISLSPLALHAEEAAKLSTEKERLSYSFGQKMGANFKKQGVELDMTQLTRGIEDALSGKQGPMTPAEVEKTMQEYQRAYFKRQAEFKNEAANKNLEAGKAFLAENAKKEGVKILDNGLQYKVIKSGSGKTPGEKDYVSVHYRGTLIDGTEFDSSYKRGTPANFPVNGVIKGWTQALQKMKEGDKWMLYIPSDLGYGLRGSGQKIQANSTLVFEVELLTVKEKAK